MEVALSGPPVGRPRNGIEYKIIESRPAREPVAAFWLCCPAKRIPCRVVVPGRGRANDLWRAFQKVSGCAAGTRANRDARRRFPGSGLDQNARGFQRTPCDSFARARQLILGFLYSYDAR